MKARTLVKAVFAVLLISALLGSGITMPASAADRSAVEDFVTRFYNLCLGRGPDPAGLKGWVDSLFDGSKTGSDVAMGFVFSQEFLEKGTLDDEYLQILYEAFFNRQPDSGGWKAWMDDLAAGKSREHVLDGFIFATEFKELCDAYGIQAFEGHVTKGQRDAVAAFVTRFYDLCLGRKPDADGLEAWTDNLIKQIQSGAEVANGFVFSKEFIEKNIPNSEFLEILYEAFFDRKPDQAGWDAWMKALNEGRHRQEVLNGFIYSKEFSELCQRFGIKGYDSPPPPPSDNTRFYGSFLMNLKLGSCAEGTAVATVGDDFSDRFDDMYLYLPDVGSSFSYSGYDDDGEYITKDITISGNTMTIHEVGVDTDGSQWVSHLLITMSNDYNSFTVSGYETDDEPYECQGDMSGSGSRLQFNGPYDGIWSGDADTSMPYPCMGGDLDMVVNDSLVLGMFTDDDDYEYEIAGAVGADGSINGSVFYQGQQVAAINGQLSGNSGSGLWSDLEGCQGSWDVTKE